MIAAGFYSERSSTGVSIHKLAEISGHSLQICRKYLRGKAIPEPLKLVEIAKQLQVSPGWLLFGDNPSNQNKTNIIISKVLLTYILTKGVALLHNQSHDNELVPFLLGLISDLGQIDTDEEQTIKIIDLAFASISHFNR